MIRTIIMFIILAFAVISVLAILDVALVHGGIEAGMPWHGLLAAAALTFFAWLAFKDGTRQ
jgi:hypothetical protein